LFFVFQIIEAQDATDYSSGSTSNNNNDNNNNKETSFFGNIFKRAGAKLKGAYHAAHDFVSGRRCPSANTLTHAIGRLSDSCDDLKDVSNLLEFVASAITTSENILAQHPPAEMISKWESLVFPQSLLTNIEKSASSLTKSTCKHMGFWKAISNLDLNTCEYMGPKLRKLLAPLLAAAVASGTKTDASSFSNHSDKEVENSLKDGEHSLAKAIDVAVLSIDKFGEDEIRLMHQQAKEDTKSDVLDEWVCFLFGCLFGCLYMTLFRCN
jgi:hypothetical protein